VADVDAEDVLELAATEDQEPVEAFPPYARDPALDVPFAFGAFSGHGMTRMPSLWKMASKGG